MGFNPWVGEIPWRKKWQPTPVFLPGKSHGWRSLAGYSPKGHHKSDATESTHTHTQLHFFSGYQAVSAKIQLDLLKYLQIQLLLCVPHLNHLWERTHPKSGTSQMSLCMKQSNSWTQRTDPRTWRTDSWFPRGRRLGEGWTGSLGLADANCQIQNG